MSITAAMVKELRGMTGVGMMECKKALVEASGNVAEAEKLLRKKGVAKAEKKSSRATGEGTVMSYIHTGAKIGVMLEVNCETDFTARNEDFLQLSRDIAMHIAAVGPRYLSRDEVSESDLAEEREIARAQAIKAGKPENIVDKIVEGKIEKYCAENTLLDQPFVKNPDVTVGQLITDSISRIGENIKVRRYTRYVLGE